MKEYFIIKNTQNNETVNSLKIERRKEGQVITITWTKIPEETLILDYPTVWNVAQIVWDNSVYYDSIEVIKA